ncbi:D-aminoacylase [uncultured Maribacter sp.]|uniref:N-acyl-D-amino-acid deacylase family protein n=1 Tax=uncultured Maribacter sp. TaxID=431308 RepID=UPI0030EBE2DB|tara:strand:- start:20462 stop:22147 length:1686 start_codon:yes stop_codon:yes gene_type:complete
MKLFYSLLFTCIIFFGSSCTQSETYDVLIKNGQLVDGSGQNSYIGDIAINGDTIAAIGNLENAKGVQEIDGTGLTVAPGFINMLSWATESLIVDGKSESDIRQGVTLEVMGEGWSMGPLNDEMRQQEQSTQKDVKYPIEWTTLGEYLEFLEARGIAPNVASFVGATTLRIHELGEANRPPTPAELENMKALAKTAMEEGAMGIGSSLIYAPAFYADTQELIELCKVASEYGGMYISHMRSEGDYWLEAIDELLKIAKEAQIPAEIYHLKAGGKENWGKWETAVAKIDSARAAGLQITTDMYNYTAGATGLDASMPPWVQEGGYGKWSERLQDPAIRKSVIEEMKTKGDGWENLYFAAGSPEKLILNGFRSDSLRYLTGKTLGEVARMRGTSPEETAIDLVVQDSSRVGTVYFLMSEENVKKQISLPYMSFGSDAGSIAPVKPFTNYSPHPRAYGNVARLLGKYVREEKVIPLEEAVYKLSGLPASNLKIKKRGTLTVGNFADLAIFDANTIIDKATFDNPHQFAEGMVHVFVNGKQVLKSGEHTGATPGRVVRGPGWKGKK